MKTKIILLVSLIVFAMTTCSPIVEDLDEMSLDINFGQNRFSEDIYYKIDIEGTKTFTHESKGRRPVIVRVPVGHYYISVTAYSDRIGGTVYATGDDEITVNARYNIIPIFLDIIGGVDTPTASPGAGTYTGPQSIILSTFPTDADIYYTLDGSAPSSSSTPYTVPITISALGVTTLKAIGIMDGMHDSGILEAKYTIRAVDKPEVNLPGGEVPYGTAITLTTATIGADIYYTLDENEPDSSSTLYISTSPITLNTLGDVILKAIAIKENIENSDILEVKYTVIPEDTVTKPTATSPEGIIISGTTVELSTTTDGADIWYTIDGITDPAKDVGEKYTAPILITVDTIIKAIAVKEGMDDSNIAEITYTAKVAKPTASPYGSAVSYGTTVELSAIPTDGADIYYTTDGTTPTASSSLYSGPIALNKLGPITLRAIAIKDGILNSNRLKAEYIIQPIDIVATPTASPYGGGVTKDTEVTLSSTTQDAEIYYTTDGSDPVSDDTDGITKKYTDTNKITIDDDTIIRAIAVKPGWTNSGILTTEYTILSVAMPIADPPAGEVPYGTGITLSTTTSGATIHYTLNGDDPTTSSPIYSGVPILKDHPFGPTVITLKAIAVRSDMNQSNPLITAYVIIPIDKIAMPEANPPSGKVISGASVITLSTLTSGAKIRYTLDGSEPNSSSTLYENPISITAVTIIKAIAVKGEGMEGMDDSTVLTIVYTPLSIEMVEISAGTFMMGQAGVSSPVHEVTLTKGFYMGKYQVTQDQYVAVMGTNPSYFHGGSGREPADDETQGKRPVEYVTWYDALIFCNKLSTMVGLTPAYKINGSTNPDDWGDVPAGWDDDEFSPWNVVEIVSGSTGYRLPTEAQWEYACRAGTMTIWIHGDEEETGLGLGSYAWYDFNSDSKTHEVGKKLPNAWGLYDMHGNVFEFCWDWNGSYPSGAQIDPLGAATGSFRMYRGGCWFRGALNSRSAYRGVSFASGRAYNVGFRVVRPPSP